MKDTWFRISSDVYLTMVIRKV